MKELTIQNSDYLYEIYRKIGQQANESTEQDVSDTQFKLDSSCTAKIHAGIGRLKTNIPSAPQDPEVKFILAKDLSMGGNTACGLAAAAQEALHGHSSRVFEGAITDRLRDAMGR